MAAKFHSPFYFYLFSFGFPYILEGNKLKTNWIFQFWSCCCFILMLIANFSSALQGIAIMYDTSVSFSTMVCYVNMGNVLNWFAAHNMGFIINFMSRKKLIRLFWYFQNRKAKPSHSKRMWIINASSFISLVILLLKFPILSLLFHVCNSFVTSYFILQLTACLHLAFYFSDQFDQIIPKNQILDRNCNQMKQLSKFHHHLNLFYDVIKWPTTFHIVTSIYCIILLMYGQTMSRHSHLFPMTSLIVIFAGLICYVLLPDIPKSKVRMRILRRNCQNYRTYF